MACGCGGECCKQIKGLGFLSIEPQDTGGGGDFWGFDDSYWQSGGDFWGFDDSYWQSGGGDFWGFNDVYWQPSYQVVGTGSDGFGMSFTMGDPSFYNQFRQTNQGQSGFDWQSLLDWWARLTGNPSGVIQPPAPSPSIFPDYSGYCPPGGYYCVDFPTCSHCAPIGNDPVAKAKAQAQAQQRAQQAAQNAARAAQQQSQGCPPNTGLVKNAQGQCVCPPGYAPNAQLKKCVLVNPALANSGANIPDWLKWLLIAGVVVLVVKR